MKPLPIALSVCLTAPAVGVRAEPAARPDRIDFKIAYQPGRVVRLRMAQKAVGAMSIGLLPDQKFSQTFEEEMTTICRKVNPDGSAEFEHAIDRIAMKMGIFGMNIEFDSRVPTTRPAANPALPVVEKIFRGMVGSRFSVTLGPDGRPTKVSGLAEMMEKMVGTLGDDPAGAAAKKMVDGFANMFNDDNMMEQMKSYSRMTPRRSSVRVGDKWTDKWEVKLPIFRGAFQGEGEYELVGIEQFRGRSCALIRIKESFHMDDPPAPEGPDAARPASVPASKGIFDRMRFNLRTSGGEGLAYWDYQTNDVVQLRQTQRMTIEISLGPDPGAEDPEMRKGFGKIVQTFNVAISVDVLDDADASERASTE